MGGVESDDRVVTAPGLEDECVLVRRGHKGLLAGFAVDPGVGGGRVQTGRCTLQADGDVLPGGATRERRLALGQHLLTVDSPVAVVACRSTDTMPWSSRPASRQSAMPSFASRQTSMSLKRRRADHMASSPLNRSCAAHRARLEAALPKWCENTSCPFSMAPE